MGSKRGTIGLQIDDFTSIDNRAGWCTSARTTLHGELTDHTRSKHCIVRHWSTISRLINISLVLLVWCLILSFLHMEDIQILIYMIFVITMVTFFETMFILHWLFCGVERKDTRLHRAWDILLGINTWKKLLLYVLLTVPAFIKPKESPATLASGIIINLIGIIDFIHLFRDKTQRRPVRYQQLGHF